MRQSGSLFVVLLVASTLAACHRGASQGRPETGRLPELPAEGVPAEEVVVARVNGRPISVAQVAQQARAAGTTREKALMDLIRTELLAQAAEARGFAGDPAVLLAGRQELVRRYLKETFETEVTSENTISSGDIKRAYERAKPRLIHPELKEVQHLLLMTPKENPQIVALMEEVRKRALTVRDEEEFSKLEPEFRQKARELRTEIRVEKLVTGRQGWTEEPFAKAAFELTQPGQISSIARTSYGYHVVRLVRNIAAENISLEEAEPKIRASLWQPARTREFDRLLQRLELKHQTKLYPERLAALEEEDRERTAKKP